MQSARALSPSPRFNSYSNGNLTEIAARVIDEFDFNEFNDEEFCSERRREKSTVQIGKEDDEEEDSVEKWRTTGDEEFEFEFMTTSDHSQVSSAAEIFDNGKIRPVYPVSNTDSLFLGGHRKNGIQINEKEKRISALPLWKLFIEERETTMTAEADDLETDGVWRPKTAAEEESDESSEKSSSNSKKWKLRNPLKISKDSVAFLRRSSTERRTNGSENKEKDTPANGGEGQSAAAYNRDDVKSSGRSSWCKCGNSMLDWV